MGRKETYVQAISVLHTQKYGTHRMRLSEVVNYVEIDGGVTTAKSFMLIS